MAEIDDLRQQIADAAESGDEASVARLSERYRDLQVRSGQLQPLGRGFVAQTGREYQLANRALELRRAGREDEATNLIRIISRERLARNITRGGRGRGEAFVFGANRGIFNLGTLASGGRELIEDTFGGNRNRVTAREHMEDLSAVQDLVRQRHPVSAGAGEITGAVVSLAAPGSGGARAAQLSRGQRVARAAVTGAGYGGAQGASDAFVRNQDVVEGAREGAQTGAVVGGTLSVFGQALAPVLRNIGNRLADNQGLRLLAEHVNPDQLNRMVAAVRQYQRQFGRPPTLAEAAGMVDQTIAREAGQIVEARVPASQAAQQGANRVRVQAQRDLAEAVLPNSSASARVTTDETNRAMQAIAGSARVAAAGSPLHNFLTRPNVSRLIRGLPPETRDAFNAVIDNNGPVTVRMLDNIRQAVGNLEKLKGADHAWTEIADEARRFADDITNGAFSRVLRRHGQNAFREEIANEALRSPAAAQRVAGDLAESAQRSRDLAAELGPAEATRIRNAGSSIQRGLRGVDEFEPRNAISRGEEAAANTAEAARAALLHKTGGAGIAAFIARNVRRLGINAEQAEQFARDFTDPSRTASALRFLEQRIGANPARNFMQMLERYGVRPTVERVAGVSARIAAQGDDTELRGTQELVNDGEEQPAPEEAEPTSLTIGANDVSDDFISRLEQIESGGRADARAPTSSATGLHQFIESTWLATIRDHADELGLQRVAQHIDRRGRVADADMRRRILELRTDPEISRAVVRALTADNLNGLTRSLGREPTEGELYAAHFLGLAGARRLIRAAERGVANAVTEFPAEARANRRIFYDGNRPRSAQEVMDELESKWA